MVKMSVAEKMKSILDPKRSAVAARLFVSREDGITVYDSIQDKTTTSVSALVCGVWQASEAMMGLVNKEQNVMEFRLGFDTSSQGVYLFPLNYLKKKYFFGAIYKDCVNPGQLKRQVSKIKEEMDRIFDLEGISLKKEVSSSKDGFLFKEITDEEMDRLFAVTGI